MAFVRLRGARRRSSVTAAFMSSSKRAGGAALSAAATSASPGNDAVPPSSESRSSASAEKPLAAKRPATLRMWSLRPRFSWMTRTAPFVLPTAGAQAAISVPRGPANVIASVAAGAHSTTVPRAPPRPRERAPPAPLVAAASLAAAPSIAIAALPVTPSSPSRRTASRRVMMPSTWSSATSSAR